MPIYEYECLKCKHKFEKLMNFSSKDTIFCEKCGEKTKRIISRCFGMDKNQQPWEYEYTHKVKPKFVKDSNGNRMPFNPNVMKKGRKGSGI